MKPRKPKAKRNRKETASLRGMLAQPPSAFYRLPEFELRGGYLVTEGCRRVLDFEPEFLEQTVVQLNQQDPALLGQVALSGMAMSNTCDKLGAGLSCLVQDAAWAGVTAAQALYRRIHEGAKNEPPQVYRVPVRASWDE